MKERERAGLSYWYTRQQKVYEGYMKLDKLQTSAKTRRVNDRRDSQTVWKERRSCFRKKVGNKKEKLKKFFKLREINGFAMEKKGYKKGIWDLMTVNEKKGII